MTPATRCSLVLIVAALAITGVLAGSRPEGRRAGGVLLEERRRPQVPKVIDEELLLAGTPPAAEDEGGATPESDQRVPLPAGLAAPGPLLPIRGRVFAVESGEPIAGCTIALTFVDRSLARTETGFDGRFELGPPDRAGVTVTVTPPWGWEIPQDSLELDAAPEQELLFPAHAVPFGLVQGTVIDEIDGTPVPFLRMRVEDEWVETDGAGGFVAAGKHALGPLEFVFAGGFTYELGDWEPGQDVVIPARVGPFFYLDFGGIPPGLEARLLPQRPASAAAASISVGWGVGLDGVVRSAFPSLVRFEGGARRPSGELVLFSPRDFIYGRAVISPGRGTASAPLPITMQPCGFLRVEIEANRRLEWYESDLFSLALVSSDGESEVSGTWESHRCGFLVIEPGEHGLVARFDGKVVGRLLVTTRLRERVSVVLPVVLPVDSEAAGRVVDDGQELRPGAVRARIMSARNRPLDGQVRLTRTPDGHEVLLPFSWKKEVGRWLGSFASTAAPGTYRVDLELDTAFDWDGPETITVPAEAEPVFHLHDAVPLADVYFAPVAAEDGALLHAFDAELKLSRGRGIGGGDFCSTTVPVAWGHPRTVPFHWVCSAPGRVPVCGRFEPDGTEGDIRIPVVLERGWGAVLFVGDPDCLPLEGVRVFLDGVLAATTDASGTACLGGERPGRIDLDHRGWTLDPENTAEISADGSFDDSELWMRAYLMPPAGR